jgi:NhaP-type Na+/H+ or K+/H+ antiporter
VRVFKTDELRLLLGVLDRGVLERRVMRLLDAYVPWGETVAASECGGVCGIDRVGVCCACGGGSAWASSKKLAFDVISIKPTVDANEPAGLKATHDG